VADSYLPSHQASLLTLILAAEEADQIDLLRRRAAGVLGRDVSREDVVKAVLTSFLRELQGTEKKPPASDAP